MYLKIRTYSSVMNLKAYNDNFSLKLKSFLTKL